MPLEQSEERKDLQLQGMLGFLISFAIEAEFMVERIFVLAYTAEPSRDTRIGGVIDLDQLSQICDL